MKKLIIFLSVILITDSRGQSNILNANTPEEIGIHNFDQVQSNQDSFFEYDFIDDRDILWSRVVYEKIDLNERINFPLLYPVND